MDMANFCTNFVAGERLFGNAGFLTVYLLSAIGGNLASLAWQPFAVAAGWCGSFTRQECNGVCWYNLIYGFKGQITGDSHLDMAAHLGGLLTGLVAGCALAYRAAPASGGAQLQRSMIVAVVALLVFVLIARKTNPGDPKQAEAYLAEMNGKRLTMGRKDIIVYSDTTEKDSRQLGQG